MTASLKALKITAIAEGVSYLLFGLTMPLKYYYGILNPNKVVGMAHGFLFIAYILMVMYEAFTVGWPFKKTLLALLASIVPFGTFIADRKLFTTKEG